MVLGEQIKRILTFWGLGTAWIGLDKDGYNTFIYFSLPAIPGNATLLMISRYDTMTMMIGLLWAVKLITMEKMIKNAVTNGGKNIFRFISNVAKSDCIPNVSYTPYIGYMFVNEKYRGQHLSQKLISNLYAWDIKIFIIHSYRYQKGITPHIKSRENRCICGFLSLCLLFKLFFLLLTGCVLDCVFSQNRIILILFCCLFMRLRSWCAQIVPTAYLSCSTISYTLCSQFTFFFAYVHPILHSIRQKQVADTEHLYPLHF